MGDDLTAWICATSSNEDLSRPQCDNCKSDVAYEVTIAAQAEELARVTAERDEAESKARYWQDRGENMRVGRERLETCIAGLREELGMQQQAAADAEAQLARMTERHGRLRQGLALIADRASKQWPHDVAAAALAADDSGGEG